MLLHGANQRYTKASIKATNGARQPTLLTAPSDEIDSAKQQLFHSADQRYPIRSVSQVASTEVSQLR